MNDSDFIESAFFATVSKGMEAILAEELRSIGAKTTEEVRAGVGFGGSLETAYRACLWSRTASRILLPLARFPAETPEQLYEGVQTIHWADHLTTEGTLAVDFASSESQISHTHFGAQKTKDAIVDQLRSPSGARPSVDTNCPDVRVNVYLRKDEASLSIDLSGESLHRRGWREQASLAPLKENLAAAILLLAGWREIAAGGGPLLDPMCGSGTIPIEAAWIAADVAPGLMRERWGFSRWLGHNSALWERVRAEALERDKRQSKLPPIVGYDMDATAVRYALGHVSRSGVQGIVHIERRDLSVCEPIGEKPGIFVVNPPYGERLGEVDDLRPLYRRIGDTLKQRFSGWNGYVFTGNLDLAKEIGLKASRRCVLYNGPIECRLLQIPIHQASTRQEKPVYTPSPESEAFSNRLKKNFKHYSKWAKREEVSCFRVYDADLPEYAVAVDLYENFAHVQEYERPPEIDQAKAEKRVRDVMAIVPEVLGVKPSDVFLKVRRKQRGASQYEKLAMQKDFHIVREGGLSFWVNFTDYLDTGLFLDHRSMRRMVGELAKERRFLNLFGYTGSATVWAAKGGAASTTTVDLSNTYLDWASRNLDLNHIRGSRHEIIRDDVLEWIKNENRRWDLIFCDPPTFSRSKSMRGTFDVQRDHIALLCSVVRLLEPGGILLFSNNLRRFKMDAEALKQVDAQIVVEEITRSVFPPDFSRNPRIHNAWKITRAGMAQI